MATSPYIHELRALIGHRRLLLPSVAVLIRNDAGQILMVANAQTGVWQTVGGAVDPLEHPADAARREAREETGLEVELTGIAGLVGGPAFCHTYPNGDEVAFAGVAFDARPAGGMLRAGGDGDEVAEARWWEPTALAGAPMEDFTRILLTDTGVLAPAPPV
ncbi:NUDIX domain-containing protein [Conexibacter sp. DBS9H8]|uniref:NUDIX domain-containing protein n=1 Tax=Conexibacter sp. DBS9H8 TaxID=2937801 RepID=UPI00200CAE25|nr:NUDIX domain-containing protein [Conexibacter sp. DBS9H8]